MSDASSGSLYQRLSGYDVVASVVDDFYERAFTDPETAVFFAATAARAANASCSTRSISFVPSRADR